MGHGRVNSDQALELDSVLKCFYDERVENRGDHLERVRCFWSWFAPDQEKPDEVRPKIRFVCVSAMCDDFSLCLACGGTIILDQREPVFQFDVLKATVTATAKEFTNCSLFFKKSRRLVFGRKFLNLLPVSAELKLIYGKELEQWILETVDLCIKVLPSLKPDDCSNDDRLSEKGRCI